MGPEPARTLLKIVAHRPGQGNWFFALAEPALSDYNVSAQEGRTSYPEPCQGGQFMETPLLTLPVRCKRDVVRAVERARQVGRLLGLDGREQAGLACGVFEMTCRAAARLGRVQVEFRLVGKALRVSFRRPAREQAEADTLCPVPSLQLSLPEELPMTAEDLAWTLRELDLTSTVNCFEAMRQQSRDLLQLLVDLQRAEGRLAEAGGDAGFPAAA
jgi:hypothetical protein